MAVAYITHPDCRRHDMGLLHPECPARIQAIHDALLASGLEQAMHHYEAREATRTQLERVHEAYYVKSVFDASPSNGMIYLDADTSMNPCTLRAALLAAGAGVLAVDLVMQGKVGSAFCNIRPPGHHAERARAMGFCIFNNIAVAAAHALADYGLERIAIIDFDVHHGNGTEDIFRDESRVLFCSTFQHPFYPYSGSDTRLDHIVNVPLPAGSDGEAFRTAVAQHWLPALENFRPEFIFCSAGFDAHAEDDMAGLKLTEVDYRWVTATVKSVAQRYACGRMVSMLEGGYALSALGRSATAHVGAMPG